LPYIDEYIKIAVRDNVVVIVVSPHTHRRLLQLHIIILTVATISGNCWRRQRDSIDDSADRRVSNIYI